MVGGLPTEGLGHLEGQRLRALGVVGPHVDVHERPGRVLRRQLRAQPVHVVVVALDRDEVAAVHRGGGDLHLLEVVGDEHVALHPGPGRVGGHRVGQVAGGRAGRDLEPELPGLRQGDGHDPVLERPRGVEGVVLHPHLAQSQLRRQPVGPHQRCEAGAEVHRTGVGRGQQVAVAPDRPGPGRDRVARHGRGDGPVVVHDLERPEAVLAHVERLGRVRARALPAAESFDEWHGHLHHRSGIGTWRFPAGCRGVNGPVPQPLWMTVSG